MSYILVLVNAIVVVLMAMYVYENERRMGEILAKLDRTVQTVNSNLEGELSSIRSAINRVESRQTSMSSDTSSAFSRLTENVKRVQTVNSNLEGELSSIRSAINRVESHQTSMFSDISSTFSRLTLNEIRGYVGCFVDDSNRLLKHKLMVLDRITLEKCRHHCRGYRYLGLQHGQWCVCGDSLHRPGYPQASELLCNTPCTGEITRMCGAAWKNSIYEV
ncbi:uncharacterized protein LOC127704479 [Mytilus californianus]|uniref:uncharacterized protein LOC127704479 n=1 Tax=Mytilus californianus TaxID=6549 RepID=UPI0022474654|nr:uncharacterized protein LOC127704479 [Mytilus californianus]